MDEESEYKHLFPIIVDVEKGKTYKWCSCRKSTNQPLCDRDDCGDKCVVYQAEITESVTFCNCKQTKNPPWCDGSHAKLLLEALKARQAK